MVVDEPLGGILLVIHAVGVQLLEKRLRLTAAEDVLVRARDEAGGEFRRDEGKRTEQLLPLVGVDAVLAYAREVLEELAA